MKNLRPLLLNRVNSQINSFSRILDKGGILYFTPDDQHSADGRFGPMRSGIYRLVRMAQTEVRILPIDISCDSMTVGRKRINVTIGPEITNLKGLTKNEFERLVQISITKLGVVSTGQLGSRFLLQMAEEDSEVVATDSELSEIKRKERSVVGWLLFLVAATYILGFMIAIPLFLFLFLKFWAKESWVLSICMSGVVLGVVFFIFAHILQVPFHSGIIL